VRRGNRRQVFDSDSELYRIARKHDDISSLLDETTNADQDEAERLLGILAQCERDWAALIEGRSNGLG